MQKTVTTKTVNTESQSYTEKKGEPSEFFSLKLCDFVFTFFYF